MLKEKVKVLFILGPTASGKSHLAFSLAQTYRAAEIISCDSMQIYRHMTIGTAQPSIKETQIIPHHLIDCFDISTYWDANLFSQKAKNLINEIQNKHHLPIIVGGTGMYAKALAYQMPLQPSDKTIFNQVCKEYENGQEKELQQELIASGEDFHPDILKNWRRLVRAVEILRITGKAPISSSKIEPLPKMKQWIILPKWEWLKDRIANRTKEMIKHGWIEETKELLNQGLLETPTARQALGYAEIANWLNQDGKDVEKLIDLLTTKTYQYARRQKTWFKKQHLGAEIFEPQNQEEWTVMERQLKQRLENFDLDNT